MVNFTIYLEVTIRVGTQQNETFISWHEIQNRALKYITFFDKVGNITSTSYIEQSSDVQYP